MRRGDRGQCRVPGKRVYSSPPSQVQPNCGTMKGTHAAQRGALVAVLMAVTLTSCAAHGMRGFADLGHGMVGAASAPVTVHNPADDMGVVSVMLGAGATDESASTGFRDAAASIVAQLTVQAAAPGVTVLGGDFAADEVARAAFNDTIDECVRALSRRAGVGLQALTTPRLHHDATQIRVGVSDYCHEPGHEQHAAGGGGRLRGSGAYAAPDLPVRTPAPALHPTTRGARRDRGARAG